MSIKRLALALVLLFAFACEMRPSDVTGVWTLTQESRERLPAALRAGAGRLTFDADGTFEAEQIPGQIFDQGPGPITGTGRWKLTDLGLQLDLLSAADGADPRKIPFSTDFRAQGDTLRYFIGDPDDGNSIDFTKVD